MLFIDQFLERLDYLPPVPRNLAALTRLLNQTDVEVHQVVEIVQYDPALTAEVLRRCNSAYFGSAEPAADVQEAIMRLGFNEIFQLLMILSVSGLMSREQNGRPLSVRELWRHSVTAALAGKVIATAHRENPSLVFTACILHDLGKIFFTRELENEYHSVLELSRSNQSTLLTAERTCLNFDHSELGGRLLELWRFPPELIYTTRFHHAPASAPPEHRRLAAYVHLADLLANFMGYGCGQSVLALGERDVAMELAGTNSEAIAGYLVQTWAVLQDTKAVISFSEQGPKMA